MKKNRQNQRKQRRTGKLFTSHNYEIDVAESIYSGIYCACADIIATFKRDGIGHTPSSLKRYLVSAIAVCCIYDSYIDVNEFISICHVIGARFDVECNHTRAFSHSSIIKQSIVHRTCRSATTRHGASIFVKVKCADYFK